MCCNLKNLFMQRAICVVLTFVVINYSFCQLNEGKKFFYYERYKSAQAALEKAVKESAKNAEAFYWLALTDLAQDKTAEAKAVIQNGLSTNTNHPLLLVALGHVSVLEDKNAAAQEYFTKALAATGAADKAAVLTAIGRANAEGNSKQGNPKYGVDMLKAAAQTDAKNPDIYVLMGICYLKIGIDKGGEAVEAFSSAIKTDPAYAGAYYRMGRIYLAQNNTVFMDEYYGKAIKADPGFAPVYLSLFNYYKERDIQKAIEYLDLYIKNTDAECETYIFQADYFIRTGKLKESLDKLKVIEKSICKDEPRIKLLYAYNYNKMGDSLAAKENIESFLAAAKKEKILAMDYKLAAEVYSKFPEEENKIAAFYQQYIDKDSSKLNKISAMQACASLFYKFKKYKPAGEWYQKLIDNKEKASSTDYYYCGMAYYYAADYNASSKIFKTYGEKYPADWRAPAGSARSAARTDSAMVTWAAAPYYEKTIMLAGTDPAANKLLVEAYKYLFAYEYNGKKNKPAALGYLDKILAIDPNNADAIKYKGMINGSGN